MFVYIPAKFEVYSKILTSFRQEVVLLLPLTSSKLTPKKATQIRVKAVLVP